MKNILSCALLLILPFAPFNAYGQAITDYGFFSALCKVKGENTALISLRSFTRNNHKEYLTVNPENLITCIHAANEVECVPCLPELIRQTYSHTLYFRTIQDAEANSISLENAGITHLLPSHQGIILTVDLCPSRLPLERTLFTKLISEIGSYEKPVPIGIAVTGIWIKKHEEDLRWLLEQEKNGELVITWINHSYYHRQSNQAPPQENFLLAPSTRIEFEILETEKLMLQSDITPSVFFRFPGLVSTDQLYKKVTAHGLIPIGSDSWLAKNQWPKEGSIVLLHANGNEPLGISRFLRLLEDQRESIEKKVWYLLDLREGLVNLEKSKCLLPAAGSYEDL